MSLNDTSMNLTKASPFNVSSMHRLLTSSSITGNCPLCPEVYDGLANPTSSSNTSDPKKANFVTDPTTDEVGAGAGSGFQGGKDAKRALKDAAGVVEDRPGILEGANIAPLSQEEPEFGAPSTKTSTAGSTLSGGAKIAFGTITGNEDRTDAERDLVRALKLKYLDLSIAQPSLSPVCHIITMPTEPRQVEHEFYETDEKLTLSVFVRNANPDQVSVKFTNNSVDFSYEDNELHLAPLRAGIDPAKSGYRVGKVKVELWLAKLVHGRWGTLVSSGSEPAPSSPQSKSNKKNWDSIVAGIPLDTDKTLQDDPNAGGDAALNTFFQQIYGNADEDTRRAMLKSYTESGGTSLSTNWDEVRKGKVEVKPPTGSEYKQWG
ncbi:unnamed protein product [Rhizoctonia solani]|uniref:Protein SGT1 n=1 Tax=Rhizoctonia solani TaxID=456999 RepID=A0A8H2XX42_9AGAM|nr:unnamed protein product [Rhizoctonia solani]